MEIQIFDFDIDTYANLIDLKVQIDCLNQRIYSGRVYTIDPITQSIVLFDESNSRVQIILRDDIQQLKILDRNPIRFDPFVHSKSISSISDQSIFDRQEQLRTFLSSKRIPFQEKFDENNHHSLIFVIQNGLVQIHSPYTNQTIRGTNEIVLSRMKFLLKHILNCD